MAEYDFDHASLLLNVAKESLGYPQLRPLHDAAIAELVDMLPKPEPVEPAEPVAEPSAFDPEEEPEETHPTTGRRM